MRSLPALANSSAEESTMKLESTWPATRSLSAGLVPL
jgi:hypothetical protein